MNNISSIDAVQSMLAEQGYICSRALGTVVFLSLKLGRPLFLEGEAGVGKTEIAKALAASMGKRLIRLQCYEGLDAATAVYEWNFPCSNGRHPYRGGVRGHGPSSASGRVI